MPKDPNDIYGVEYETIRDVHVFSEGEWNNRRHDARFIEDIAESYDPALIRAKVCVDHEWRGPAYGHVLALKAVDDKDDLGKHKLVATLGLLPAGAQMIRSGQYNERSIGYSTWYPTSGIPYLWEVSLLGANTPAVSGMDPLILDEDDTQEAARADIEEAQAFALDGMPTILEAKAVRLVWDVTENYIRHRVRQESRFRSQTLRTVALSEETGIWSIQGKLKTQYVPEGKDPELFVIQAILFSREEKYRWTLKRARAWVKSRKDQLASAWAPAGHVLIGVPVPGSAAGEPEPAVGIFAAVPAPEAPIVENPPELRLHVAREDRKEPMLFPGWEDKPDWDEIRYRVRDPGLFQDDSFRRLKMKSNPPYPSHLFAIIGRLKGKTTTTIQALRFPKKIGGEDAWNLTNAKAWLKKNPDVTKGVEAPSEDMVMVPDGEGGMIPVPVASATPLTAAEILDVFAGGDTPASDKVESTTATAEGGKADMPDTKAGTLAAAGGGGDGGTTPAPGSLGMGSQPLNVSALRQHNTDLETELEQVNERAREEQRKLTAEISARKLELQRQIVETRVKEMRVAGYIAPAQINLGLVDALMTIPEDAKVGETPALDIILEALRHGGKLRLREEIAAKAPEKKAAGADRDLDKLEESGVRVTGLDTARRVRELMRENPKLAHADALIQAKAEIGGEG